MISKAIVRYLRISPRKTRKVIDLVRGLPAVKAKAILDAVDKRPAIYVKRLLRSALDSADKKFHLLPADLCISSIKADGGPMLKRYRAASMGRATMIRHRTSHITLELDRIMKPEAKVLKEQEVKTKEPKAKVVKGKTSTRTKKSK